jgi:hypothetical protein
MSWWNRITKSFKALGRKVGQGAKFIGQKALTGLDYTIQGAKIATDFADKYTLGLDHLIPYYSAIKAGIDISDHVRKMIKHEETLNWDTALDIGMDVGFGALSAYGGREELEGLKSAASLFKGARAGGAGIRAATKVAAPTALKAVGLHPGEAIKSSVSIVKAARKGDIVARAKVVGATVGGTGFITQMARDPSSDDERRKIAMDNSKIDAISTKDIKPNPNARIMKPTPSQPEDNIKNLTLVPQNLVYTPTGIYQNGILVG